jgi:citrate lyase subunit beta / citryl-CoA lyase
VSNNAGRSWLLVSMSKAADIERATRSGADVVVLDLVELVADNDKAAARQNARAAIERVRASGARVYVQTTPDAYEADLRASMCAALEGVVVSRAESVAQVAAIDKYMFLLEKENSLAASASRMVLALETARGNQDAYGIVTASPRVCGVTLGRADLVMDLRPEPSGDLHLMPYLMERLIIIARAAGVTPLGAWWRAPDRGLLSTPENTLQAAKRGRAVGFKGALCLRADQIESLNIIYA